MPEKENLAEKEIETRAAELVAREVSLHNERVEFNKQKDELQRIIKGAEQRFVGIDPTKAPLPYCPVRDGGLIPFPIPTDVYDQFLKMNKRIQKIVWVNSDHYMREVRIDVDQFTDRKYWEPLQPGDKVESGQRVMRASSIPQRSESMLEDNEEAPKEASVPRVKINEFGIVELEA